MSQCLDALWSGPERPGQEHAWSLRGVGLSDHERGLGPAAALWRPGSLSGLGEGQIPVATHCCAFMCVTTCVAASSAELGATGCSAKVGSASSCAYMAHVPSKEGWTSEPRPRSSGAKVGVVYCRCSCMGHTELETAGCSAMVAYASCCWCMAPGPYKGLLPAQLRTTGCSAMMGSVPLCSRLQQLPEVMSPRAAVLGATHRMPVAAMLENVSVQWAGSASCDSA